jgi:hypothetical protein
VFFTAPSSASSFTSWPSGKRLQQARVPGLVVTATGRDSVGALYAVGPQHAASALDSAYIVEPVRLGHVKNTRFVTLFWPTTGAALHARIGAVESEVFMSNCHSFLPDSASNR